MPRRKLREEVIQLYHNIPIKKHRRRQKTMELMTRNYWWSVVTKEIKKYMNEYNAC